MTAITKLLFSPVPANFCCGWVESPICYQLATWVKRTLKTYLIIDIFTLTKRSKPFHKRYIKPNGFFSIVKRGVEDMEDYYMDYEEDLDLAEDLEEEPAKREEESIAPHSKMPELFWATRG